MAQCWKCEIQEAVWECVHGFKFCDQCKDRHIDVTGIDHQVYLVGTIRRTKTGRVVEVV